MLFQNIWMLAGIAGIAIPVIIHLLNRRQAKIIDWGAMLFLLDSLLSRRRRVLLEEILLLAARCLIVALIALALARPFIPASSSVPWMIVLPAGLLAVVLFGVSFALWRYPAWRWRVTAAALLFAALAAGAILFERWLNLRAFGRGGSRDVALVIDGSSSMTMSIDGQSNFARAVKEAEKYIESSPRNFAFSLVIAGSVPNALVASPVTDRKQLLQALEEAQPVQGTMQALDTMAVAATTLAQGYNPGKQIIVIGDGQRVGWKADTPELWEHLQQVFARLPAPPQIIYRRMQLPEAIRNATLASITPSRQVIGTDRAVRFDVVVANTGTEAITPQEVRLRIGERTLTDRSIGQLLPGASATVSFSHRFERAGTEVIRAQVAAGDELPGDDEAMRVVVVMDRLRVLVVDATPATRFLDRPGAFVALGLLPDVQSLVPAASATSADVEKLRHDFLVAPVVISAAELAGRKTLGDVSAIVLVDVPQLSPEMATALRDFVQQGGGLLVVAGGRVNPEFYNSWRGEPGNVMPLQLEKFIVAGETNRPAFDLKTFTHAALRPLAAGTDLDRVQFERYWQAPEGDFGVGIGARLANGVPFLAERRFGRGQVLQINVPMDVSAGNFVARQAFVPLVHELVYYLAQPVSANLNVLPARGATIQLAGNVAERLGDGRRGLRGEYFASRAQRAGGVVRLDPTVDFNWNGAPVEGVPGRGFWVQWTGSIQVSQPGAYKFSAPPGSDLTLWIDGRKVLSAANGKGGASLRPDQRHDFRVDFVDDAAAGSTAQLTMAGPGLPPQRIPTQMLSPLRGRDDSWSSGVETMIQGPDKQPFGGRYVTGSEGVALRIDRSLVPGLHRAKVPEAVMHKVNHLLDREGTIPFSVMVDGEESRLAPLSQEELLLIGKYVPFLVAGSVDEVVGAMFGKAFGRELWQTLAFAALILLILEVVLTRWIAIQRRTGEEGNVDFEENAQSSAQFRAQLAAMKGTAPAETKETGR
ncbi:MAG: BatA domain-containing protein [bacterium]